MLTDALTQFLVFKKWRKVLLLRGAEPDDIVYASAFIRSAKRYGIKITKTHEFKHGNDPRQRDKNNVALLTSGSNADVVFIADIEGEFGRYVPYQTQSPLLVFGTEGLQATSWHWAWERHGAPQLNQRFEKHAKRRMQGPDWAAWAAVKSIIESVIRTRSTDFKKVQTYLLSDKLNLDVYKGAPASYRLWDNQLRQPILLHSHNAIIDRAPIRGFLHQTENMDTLGDDIGDKRCQF
jgi:ABC transporter substrate binding protein (PQQ-dependent alcohol dehydrogenase system)